MKAIVARKPTRAESAMRTLLTDAADRIERALDESVRTISQARTGKTNPDAIGFHGGFDWSRFPSPDALIDCYDNR
jgi:hypothetical protein